MFSVFFVMCFAVGKEGERALSTCKRTRRSSRAFGWLSDGVCYGPCLLLQTLRVDVRPKFEKPVVLSNRVEQP